MKRCRHITCWTDYSFTELGDVVGERAPIRHVTFMRFHGYSETSRVWTLVRLMNTGKPLRVKACYLYSQPGRCGEVRPVNIRKLERMLPNEADNT